MCVVRHGSFFLSFFWGEGWVGCCIICCIIFRLEGNSFLVEKGGLRKMSCLLKARVCASIGSSLGFGFERETRGNWPVFLKRSQQKTGPNGNGSFHRLVQGWCWVGARLGLRGVPSFRVCLFGLLVCSSSLGCPFAGYPCSCKGTPKGHHTLGVRLFSYKHMKLELVGSRFPESMAKGSSAGFT